MTSGNKPELKVALRPVPHYERAVLKKAAPGQTEVLERLIGNAERRR